MKRIFDEEGRLFGKFSVIDITAVLLALALVVAVFLRFSKTERYVDVGPVQTGVDYTYTFKVSGVRMFTANAIRVGDEFYTDNGKVLGTVTGIEITDSVTNVTDVYGNIVEVANPERVDLVISFKTHGEIRGGKFYTDSTELAAGESLSIHSKYVITSGVVRSISQ